MTTALDTMIRIAYENPELRPNLLPIIQKNMEKKANPQGPLSPEVREKLETVLKKALKNLGIDPNIKIEDLKKDPEKLEEIQGLTHSGGKSASKPPVDMAEYKRRVKDYVQAGVGAGTLLSIILIALGQAGVDLGPAPDLLTESQLAALIAVHVPLLASTLAGYIAGKALVPKPKP